MVGRPLRPQDPRRLGGYELLARLGEGGMGTVFLGRDPSGRQVAVKAIRPEYADQEEFRGRFRSEVNRARQVPSFCTAAVLDADPDSETPYLVVEYVDGPSLQKVVKERGPMSAGDLHSVAAGMAAALTAIHGAGVIHRDLKPTNVLLAYGLPKVIDFGIARALDPTSLHTRTDQVVGTVAYMAPERLDSSLGETTPAADIFSWGAVVTYAATGRTPFGGDTPMATVARILTMRPDLTGLPPALSGLVDRALAKDPRDRPTAGDLVQELLAVSKPEAALLRAAPAARGRFDSRELIEQLIAEGPRPARAVSAPETRRRRLDRLPLVVAAALVLVLGLVATIAYAMSRPSAPTSAPAPPPSSATAKLFTAQGPSLFDPLSEPGRFQAANDGSGSCAFAGGRLHARTKASSTYRCAGPADSFGGDQTIEVNVALPTTAGCAMVWFRYQRDTRGYQLTACTDLIELEKVGGAVLTTVGRVQSGALKPGDHHDLTIRIADDYATVSVDGTLTMQAGVADPNLTSGRVMLGVTAAGSRGTAEASFAALSVRAG